MKARPIPARVDKTIAVADTSRPKVAGADFL